MDLTSRTFLFIFCALTATEAFNGGVIQKRLQLFKNAADHVRTITFPVEGKHHGMRRDCHPICHGHHRHDHHHHGYGHHHHQKHDHHHHGHHKLSFGRAIYQDPYYHVSPQLFYFNKKPLNQGYSQYYSNKFSPYWFNRYNYSPYQMKPLMPTYNYYLKPLYYYLRNPQILTPVPQVTWIKPHEYHVYPIDNQVSSEDSVSVADHLNNPVSHNAHEENGMTNAQILVQDSDLDTENYQSNENDNAPSITDVVAEETNTTPKNKIHNVNINGDSTSYYTAEHTTHQYTPMIDNSPSISDIVAEETNTTPILENKIHDVNINGDSTSYNTAEHTTHQYTPMIDNSPSISDIVAEETNTTPFLENRIHDVNINGDSTSYNTAEHTTHQYTPMIDLDEINESSTPSVRITASFDNGKEDTTAPNQLNIVYTTKSDDSFNFEVSDSSRTTVPSYDEKNIENSYSTHQPIAITDSLEHEVTIIGNEPSLKDVTGQTVTPSPLETFNDQTTEISPERGHVVDFGDSSSSITEADSDEGLKFETSGGTEIPEFLRTNFNDFQSSTTRSYDVTTPEIFTDQNEVDLFNYDQIFTTVETPKTDDVDEREGSPTLQTLPQNNFEEQTTIDSHVSDESSTRSLEPNDRHYTTAESPKKDEMREYEESLSSQTISQNRFEESTTISSNFNDEASSETLDQELLLFEEFIKTILESETASPEISYYSDLFQSKEGIEIEEPNERTTVRSFTGEAIDSSVKESSTMDNWRSVTISPAHTGSELIPDYNVYRDLEDESNLKTTVSSNSLEITTPIPIELDEEESLKVYTVPVTSSSTSTDFDRDYEEGPAEKSMTNTPSYASSVFTDFTEDSENEFSKSKAQIVTTFSPTSIYTDSTENSKVRLSGFKFESNTILTTPSAVYNDFTENYPRSTQSSSKIENTNFSTDNISSDKTSSDNLNDEILEDIIGNTGHEAKIDSEEVTTNYYTKENWIMEDSIKSGDEKKNESKVTEDEILVNEEKDVITEAWNEKISIEFSETTTLRADESKPVEREGVEFGEIEKDHASVSKIEESEKQNISDSNIATEKNSLIPEDSSYVSEKYSEVSHYHSNAVTSKSDSIEVFQAVEPTTMYQENKKLQTPVSSIERDFGNIKIESIDRISDSTTPTLETFDSSTVEDRELHTNKVNNDIQDIENLPMIFEHHGNNGNDAELAVTTELSYVTDLNNVRKISNSEYENEPPTIETPSEYGHGNLFEEIKNVIINTPVASDNHYPEKTDANIFYDTTILFRTDQYEQTTFQPDKLQSQNSIDKLNAGEDDSDNISGEDDAAESWFAENKNNTIHDDQLGLESSFEAEFDSKMNISIERTEIQGDPLSKNDEDSVNEAKEEESHLNELNLSQNISQEEKNLQITSPNYNSLVENDIDQTTLSSEAGTKLDAHPSNQENEEGKEQIVSGQILLNDTVDVDNTSNELQSNVDDYSDGVIRVYEELDTSFPGSEIALQNQTYNKPGTVDEKTEEFEPVTEKKEQDVEEKATEIFPLKQFHEPLFIENLNETENQAAKNNSIDEVNGVESSTRAQFSDYTEMESIIDENKGEEIVSANDTGNSPFHLDLLNLNETIQDNSEKELSNKSSMIEEVTYYNIKNLEENSNGDNLFVAVNDEETNRTGLLSLDELIDVNDDSTNNYELRRSVRYEYNPYYIVSDSTLKIRKPSSNMKYQNDRSAKPRSIAKRDVMKANAAQISRTSGEFATEKRETQNDASAILGRDLTSSYQGEEAYDDDEDYDYNDYEPLSNANPSDLIEVENEEEEDTKLTNDFGPSILELFDLNRRLNKQ